MISFTIPGTPYAQKRHRVRVAGTFAQTYDPPENRSWKGAAQTRMMEEMGDRPPMDGPLRVTLSFVFPLPKSKHRKRVPRPADWSQNSKDLDNLAKAVLDAGNGILYLDDRQVCWLILRKWTASQGEPGCVSVHIEPAGDFR